MKLLPPRQHKDHVDGEGRHAKRRRDNTRDDSTEDRDLGSNTDEEYVLSAIKRRRNATKDRVQQYRVMRLEGKRLAYINVIQVVIKTWPCSDVYTAYRLP